MGKVWIYTAQPSKAFRILAFKDARAFCRNECIPGRITQAPKPILRLSQQAHELGLTNDNDGSGVQQEQTIIIINGKRASTRSTSLATSPQGLLFCFLCQGRHWPKMMDSKVLYSTNGASPETKSCRPEEEKKTNAFENRLFHLCCTLRQ